MTPTPDHLRAEIDFLANELESFSSSLGVEFDAWRYRVNQVISEVIGPNDALAIKFNGLRWESGVSATVRRSGGGRADAWTLADVNAFAPSKEKSEAILKSLRWHLDRADSVSPPETGTVVLDGTTIEPDLWDHVKGLVESGDWEKVPRESAVYVEDRLRVWADLKSAQRSVDVFKTALGPTKFALGSTDSEQQGWRQLATGFALALRNSGGHRLHDRDDLRRYAIGVLGTASLLLCQIRYQYGDPPAVAEDASGGN
ncbi:MAG: TIGR02391 family protein [Actinobacteria bacterium]|jgi:hypothetical protein|nr:TIGR02391 family protein [Actinomycetota bacterium]